MEKEKVVRSVISEKIIKELLLKCAADRKEKLIAEQQAKVVEIKDEKPWPMPEMVGFYNQATLASLHPITSEDLTIKKLVCSPDLPITSYPSAQPHSQEAAASAESIPCTICNKMFTSKTAFQAHQRTHGKETEDPYRCDICSKTFAVPARLTRHYRTHTGEKPFRCEFCNKSFSVKENLSVHRRIHTKERPYKCEVCQRAFEHSGKLHRHMRIHTGERPHKCSVCAKTFIQSGQLVIHMRTHTGEKPYVCTVCQKGFTCSKQLKVHSRTHTGEKPYSCEICGKSFGYNHVLKLHQVAHYGEKVYKCTICNSTFNSKKSMEAHIKSHSDGTAHPAQPPTPPASNPSSESSCSSTISEKENFKTSLSQLSESMSISSPDSIQTTDEDVMYVYSRGRLSPSYIPTSYPVSSAGVELLAAAASVRESVELYGQPNADLYLSLVTAPQTFRPAFYPQATVPAQSANLNAGDDIRKRVEEALMVDDLSYSKSDPTEASICSSPPVSPVSHTGSIVSPPASPNPELSIPPKKRMKMIQKSMEQERTLDLSPVRYSVIQYARST